MTGQRIASVHHISYCKRESTVRIMGRYVIGSTHEDASSTLWEMEEHGTMKFIAEVSDDFQNASWICQSNRGPVLYSTNETRGSVCAKKVLNNVDYISHLCSLACQAQGSTHVVESRDSNFLVLSNFHSGSISIVSALQNKLTGDIELGGLQIISHVDGSGRAAHAHQCVMHPTKDLFYVCDLGLDAIYAYQYVYHEQSAVPIVSQVGVWKAPAGSGPRHMVLDEHSANAFVVFEISNQVCMLSVDPLSGCLQEARSADGDTTSVFHSTMPEGVSTADMGAAEILLSADGRHVYVSNRDVAAPTAGVEDRSSITVFAVLPGGMGLQWVQTVSSRGRHPRHMCFTRGGDCLLVANRDAQNLVAFSVDRGSGMLDESTAVVTQCVPRCRDPGFILELP